VKDKLKGLGYPITEVNEICDDELIKAIKFFQVFNCKLK
jgi:hypothetical protein